MKFIKHLSLLLLLIPGLAMASEQSATEQTKAAWASSVQKINDDLFVGKVNDEFYLAMERITPDSRKRWMEYGKRQVTSMRIKYLRSPDGSSHFREVIGAYYHADESELWVAYATRIPVKEMARLLPSNDADIEMFVTIATSTNALITSHMGISRSMEAALDLQPKQPQRTRQPDQSVQLHSFAAKIMKLRDPKKIYMLTAPNEAMRNILLKKMPAGSVFIGDSIYKETVEAAEKDPHSLLDSDDLEEKRNKTPQEQAKGLKDMALFLYAHLEIKEKIATLTTNPPRIIREKTQEKWRRANNKFHIQKSDGSILATFDQDSKIYQWMFTSPYWDRGLGMPYVLVDLTKLAEVGTLVHEKSLTI